MLCKKCTETAIFDTPSLCKLHFSMYIEGKVFDTIKRFKLISPKEKIVVAASGGKDSLTLLYILSKRFNPRCLAIDEGITGYRDNTLTTLKEFCLQRKIKLMVVSYKSEFGGELGNYLNGKGSPCSVCGTLRRYLLNKYAKGYDKLCTGHNMDDEAQAIIMNFLKPNIETMTKTGYKSGITYNDIFVQRVKPFYFIKEKEIVTYAHLNNIPMGFDECPHAVYSYRAKIRDLLNEYEAKYPGTKENIIDFFLSIREKIKHLIKERDINLCNYCGEPAKGEVCNTCKIVRTHSNFINLSTKK